MIYKVFAEGEKEQVWCTLKDEEYVERVWPQQCCFPGMLIFILCNLVTNLILSQIILMKKLENGGENIIRI